MPGALAPLLLEGFVFGWSVAWPPGPINAEIIRRGVARGFRAAMAVALGAGSGDALWAAATALGAGLVLNGPAAQRVLGWISTAAAAGAGLRLPQGRLDRPARAAEHGTAAGGRLDADRAGYALGLGMSLTSPWNMAFWFAVMGRPEVAQRGLGPSLVVAGAVMLGAIAWCLVLSSAIVLLRLRWSGTLWDIVAKGATGLLMLAFAARGLARLVGA